MNPDPRPVQDSVREFEILAVRLESYTVGTWTWGHARHFFFFLCDRWHGSAPPVVLMAAESGRLQAGQGQGKRGKGRQTAICASLCPSGVHNSNLPFPPLSLCVQSMALFPPSWALSLSMGSWLYVTLSVHWAPPASCVHSSLTRCVLDFFFLLAIRLKPSLSPSLNVGHEHAVWCGTRFAFAFLHCKRYLSTTRHDALCFKLSEAVCICTLGLAEWQEINVITPAFRLEHMSIYLYIA